MKKLLSVIMAVALMATVTVSFSACAKKEYKDTVVTEIVTDKDGKQVTDKDGKPVTEVVSTTEGNSDSESTSEKDTSGASGKETTEKTTKKNGKTTEKKTEKKDTTKKETTTKKKTTTTTKPSTTEKPKKRAVTVTVRLPYYNDETHDMTVCYKLPGDKEYRKEKPQEVVLDGSEHIVKLGNLKGDVKVIVKIDGLDSRLSQNRGTILSNEDNIVIRPATGIEMMDGGLD